MIQLLETGLKENIDTVKRQNLYEQKGILHFVLQEFNAANESFEAAGQSKRIGQLRELSLKYSKIKPVDKKRLTDQQLADLFRQSTTAHQMTLFYVYYHHMRRRPARAKAEEYIPLAAAVLDKLNYTNYSKKNGLKFSQSNEGNSLDLSGSPYTVFSINIIGVYRRNVVSPLQLKSLNLSNTRLEHLYELRGMKLDELNISGVKISARNKSAMLNQVNPFKLKRLLLDMNTFPNDTLDALRQKMEVVDAKSEAARLKKKAAARAF